MGGVDSAKDLYDQGLEAFRRGDADMSLALNEQALELARREGDELNQVRALIGLSRVAFRREDHARLEELCAEATPLFEGLEDPTQTTSPVHMLAESARMQGDLDSARGFYERSIAMSRATGDDRMVAIELNNMAFLELAAGHPNEALRLARESLTLVQGDDDMNTYCLLAIGAALVASGHEGEGVMALSVVDKMLKGAGTVLDPADQPLFDDAVEAAKLTLGREDFERAWNDGSAVSSDEAIRRFG
ncbi:MAG: tetratricopeptide repeat protein [Actinomycetota bacterium]